MRGKGRGWCVCVHYNIYSFKYRFHHSLNENWNIHSLSLTSVAGIHCCTFLKHTDKLSVRFPLRAQAKMRATMTNLLHASRSIVLFMFIDVCSLLLPGFATPALFYKRKKLTTTSYWTSKIPSNPVRLYVFISFEQFVHFFIFRFGLSSSKLDTLLRRISSSGSCFSSVSLISLLFFSI